MLVEKIIQDWKDWLLSNLHKIKSKRVKSSSDRYWMSEVERAGGDWTRWRENHQRIKMEGKAWKATAKHVQGLRKQKKTSRKL